MTFKDIYYEIKYYPRRVLKYKTLWLWGERMYKIRQHDKKKRYRSKGYARLRNSQAKMEMLGIKKCLICGTGKNLTIDHIKPVSLGGKNNIENLQVLCSACNQIKGNKYQEKEVLCNPQIDLQNI